MPLQYREWDSVEPAKYRVRCHCTNCGRDFWSEFEKGQLAPRCNIQCPVCKTRTGNKAYLVGLDV